MIASLMNGLALFYTITWVITLLRDHDCSKLLLTLVSNINNYSMCMHGGQMSYKMGLYCFSVLKSKSLWNLLFFAIQPDCLWCQKCSSALVLWCEDQWIQQISIWLLPKSEPTEMMHEWFNKQNWPWIQSFLHLQVIR